MAKPSEFARTCRGQPSATSPRFFHNFVMLTADKIRSFEVLYIRDLGDFSISPDRILTELPFGQNPVWRPASNPVSKVHQSTGTDLQLGNVDLNEPIPS